MGEGWSDGVDVYLTRFAKDTRKSDVSVGWYVLDKSASGNGIRQYPYSTNMKTNPHKYSDIRSTT
jgi:extracellular elastinolytic metalloproteinase